MQFKLLNALAFTSGCLAQLASQPPSGLNSTSSIPVYTTTSNASINVAPYQTNTSLVYLGYQGDDWTRHFSKYWNPVLDSISDEQQKGITESPHASALTFSPQEAADYLTRPGYLNLENGWAIGDDGVLMLAIRTDMGNVTGDMYDWWFGWHLVDSARYKLWHPLAHEYAWRYPDMIDWSNKSLPQRYIGSYSFIIEYIGNDASKLTVNFVDPASVGFNTSAFDSQGIETIVVGKITTGHVTNVTGNSYLMHQIRRKENGQRELRSRFFLEQYSEDQPHDLGVHCGVEMTHLATFLPQLYDEFKGTL